MNEKMQLLERLIPNIPIKQGIPKIIHQTYRTKHLPVELSDNIKRLKALNPDWEYRLYDDADIDEFIVKEYGEEVFGYYKKITPRYGAAKADLFRYLLIYRIGGVYLDIKSSITKPLDNTLRTGDSLVLSHWDNDKGRPHENWGHYKEIKHIEKGEYQQWHIIAAPGHPFIRSVIIKVLNNIDEYNPYRNGVGLEGTLVTTGPIAYSLVMHEQCKTKEKYRIVDGATEIGLQYSIYEKQDGAFGHKEVLNSNYNVLITPIIDNGYKQGVWYRFYFKQVYFRKITFERKLRILKREMNTSGNVIAFICSYIFNKIKKR